MLAGTPFLTRPKSSGCSSSVQTRRPLRLQFCAVTIARMEKWINSFPFSILRRLPSCSPGKPHGCSRLRTGLGPGLSL